MNRRSVRRSPRTLPLTILAVVATLSIGTGAVGEAPATVAPADLAALIGTENGPLLLDVRSAEEFAGGHVPGALLIPVEELPERLDQIAAFKDRGVVAYCERGGRARKALGILEAAGFANLTLLEGSMQRYRKEMPTE